jgi:concanavalin A-like lectin/glucanase superfamily protein
MRIDVNGSLQNTTASSLSVENHAAALMFSGKPTGGEWYGGLLDEVAIYPTALSPTRIAAHYSAGR